MKTLALAALLASASAIAADKAADKPAETQATENTDKTAVKPSTAMEGVEYSDAEECHIKTADKPMPVIHALIASRGLSGSNDDQLRIALGTAIANGCDLNEPDQAGLQPLNAAILFNDAEIVALLLEKGADPYQPIHKPGSKIDGNNSFDFLQKIQEKEKTREKAPDRSAVATALQKYR